MTQVERLCHAWLRFCNQGVRYGLPMGVLIRFWPTAEERPTNPARSLKLALSEGPTLADDGSDDELGD